MASKEKKGALYPAVLLLVISNKDHRTHEKLMTDISDTSRIICNQMRNPQDWWIGTKGMEAFEYCANPVYVHEFYARVIEKYLTGDENRVVSYRSRCLYDIHAVEQNGGFAYVVPMLYRIPKRLGRKFAEKGLMLSQTAISRIKQALAKECGLSVSDINVFPGIIHRARVPVALDLCTASGITELLKNADNVPDLKPVQPVFRYMASWPVVFDLPAFVNDPYTPVVQVPTEIKKRDSVIKSLRARGWGVEEGGV